MQVLEYSKTKKEGRKGRAEEMVHKIQPMDPAVALYLEENHESAGTRSIENLSSSFWDEGMVNLQRD